MNNLSSEYRNLRIDVNDVPRKYSQLNHLTTHEILYMISKLEDYVDYIQFKQNFDNSKFVNFNSTNVNALTSILYAKGDELYPAYALQNDDESDESDNE